jgi:hypothetical protein
LIALGCGAGAGLRLALSGEGAGVAGWAAGAVFVPSLALALGVWSGSSKFFEGLYTALWYVGPLNHSPGLDYTGSANGARTLPDAGVYVVLAAALLAAAFFRRKAELRG